MLILHTFITILTGYFSFVSVGCDYICRYIPEIFPDFDQVSIMWFDVVCKFVNLNVEEIYKVLKQNLKSVYIDDLLIKCTSQFVDFQDNIDPSCTDPLWSCWDSQMLDITRVKLIDLFNSYKFKLAHGTLRNGYKSHKGVFKLQYHWFLEILASWHFLRSTNQCKLENNVDVALNDPSAPSFDDYDNLGIYENGDVTFGGPHPEHYKKAELMITSFRVDNNAEQIDAINEFERIMENETLVNQLFNLWKANQQNGLGSADLFGCSLMMAVVYRANLAFGRPVLPSTPEKIAALACVFASKYEDGLYSDPGLPTLSDCIRRHDKTAVFMFNKVNFDNETLLCEWVSDEDQVQLGRPCQIYYHATQFLSLEQERPCKERFPIAIGEFIAPDETIIVKMKDGDVVLNSSIKIPTPQGLPILTPPNQQLYSPDDQNAPGEVSLFLIIIPVIICVGIFLIVINSLF